MSETKYDPYAPPPPPVLEESYAIPEPIPPATEVFPAPEPMVASEPFPLMAGGLSSVPPICSRILGGNWKSLRSRPCRRIHL